MTDFLPPGCYEAQGFAQNYNPAYHAGGLLGHTGVDVHCGWGSPIYSIVAGEVISTFAVERPASDGFTAIFILVKTPLEYFEWCIGHVSEINVKIGDQVKVGDLIGKEGNYGTVYSGNRLITLAEQRAGNHEGAHRHYQKRPVVRVTRPQSFKVGESYLQQVLTYDTHVEAHIYTDAEGMMYRIYDYQNGYNGCVDWAAPLFNRNLRVGMSGYDVYLLQKACVLGGFASYTPTGFFGLQTFAGVVKLQSSVGLPTTGFVGQMTRAKLNATYQQLV